MTECRGWQIRKPKDDEPSEDDPGPSIWPKKRESREDFIERCEEELTKCIGASAAANVCADKWESAKELGKKQYVAFWVRRLNRMGVI
jgi:hypothetical protein